MFAEGSGCGSIGRVVASNAKNLQFESSPWQFHLLLILLNKLNRYDKNKDKRDRESSNLKKLCKLCDVLTNLIEGSVKFRLSVDPSWTLTKSLSLSKFFDQNESVNDVSITLN